jgi:hypothetical protein
VEKSPRLSLADSNTSTSTSQVPDPGSDVQADNADAGKKVTLNVNGKERALTMDQA